MQLNITKNNVERLKKYCKSMTDRKRLGMVMEAPTPDELANNVIDGFLAMKNF
jgi:hypothetical protein